MESKQTIQTTVIVKERKLTVVFHLSGEDKGGEEKSTDYTTQFEKKKFL